MSVGECAGVCVCMCAREAERLQREGTGAIVEVNC